MTTVLQAVNMGIGLGNAEVLAEYKAAANAPGILHYCGAKPWDEGRKFLADLWWKTADATPVGPALRIRMERMRGDRLAEGVSLMGRPCLFLTYSFYKVATLFVTGSQRKEYKRRAKLLKYIIRHEV